MFDASEAKQLTQKALSEDSETIGPCLQHIESKIRAAAKKGESEISHPFAGCESQQLTPQKKDAIRAILTEKGFTWKHHDFSNSPDPREQSYDTVSW